MTKLLKIESYVECCHYARLFDRNPDDFIPASEDLPIAYKGFLETASEIPYINHSVVASELAPELNTSKKPVNNYIGHDVDDSSSNKLLIVRDSNILSLRQLRQQYLYTSAYYYWNYVSQISKSINLQNHQVVFIDLDAFTPAARIPIEFRKSDRTSHLIPILDTRKIGTYDSLNLKFDPKTVYKNICDRLAQEIINKNSTITSTALNSISTYLQEINFFTILEDYLARNSQSGNFFQAVKSILNTNSRNISFLIKFSQNNQDYYTKAELEIDRIDKIVTEIIDFETLLNFARKNSNYKIVLISQYNFLPKFRSSLSSGLCLPNINTTEFDRVWREKQVTNFPLFGQYLDKISFEVGVEPNNFWIDVPSQDEVNIVSFEGESKMQKFIGKYKKGNEVKDRFTIKTHIPVLPIKINEVPYSRNGVEQSYQIENQFYIEEPELLIQISFSVKLGMPPILEVRDFNNRRLNNELINKPEPSIPSELGYIPFKEIILNRKEKAESQSKLLSTRIDINEFRNHLKQISSSISSSLVTSQPQEEANLSNLLKGVYSYLKENESFKFINPDDPKIIDYAKIITDNKIFSLAQRFILLLITKHIHYSNDIKITKDKLSKIKQKIANIPQKKGNTNSTLENLGIEQNNLERQLTNYVNYRSKLSSIYQYLILFLGRLYQMSLMFSLDDMFHINHPSFNFQSQDEYIKFLTRVAVNSTLQKPYISQFTFNSPFKAEKKMYQLQSYIWGYSRIFMWYLNFQSAYSWLDYRGHFIAICNSLIDGEAQNYLQDGFLIIIYLLTFREYDHNFCYSDTNEYRLAKAVVEKFKLTPIESRQMGEKIVLNNLFAKLIDNVASAQEVANVVYADYD
jgi:hypothetical protein